MGRYVAAQLVKRMLRHRLPVEGSRVLVLGLTFKENCPDIRNTRVVDVIAELKDYGIGVDVYDPWVNRDDARCEYGIELAADLQQSAYHAAVVAVGHDCFRAMGAHGVRELLGDGGVLYDLKYVFAASESDLRL